MKHPEDFMVYSKEPHNIYFKFNDAKVEDEGILKMDMLIMQLKKVRNAKLVMYGYTDSVGANDYNLKLAARRIDSVKKILVQSGVITENNILIETKILGEHDPLLSYHTINNDPHSRRVEIYITSV